MSSVKPLRNMAIYIVLSTTLEHVSISKLVLTYTRMHYYSCNKIETTTTKIVPKSNRKIVGKIDIPNTQLHDRSLS